MSSSNSKARAPTVEDASPSPPPLPDEPPPVIEDQPIDSLGDGEDIAGEEDDEEEEWDPAAEKLPPGAIIDNGKGKATSAADDDTTESGARPWQAVWSAEQNAWYFWHTITGEVTWTNPLAPPLPGSTPSDAPPLPNEPPPLPSEAPPLPNEPLPPQSGPPDIDPGLHYLLPPEQRGMGLSKSDQVGQTALFNARTGRFTANSYQYTVGHLDEYNRANRMQSHYYDVEAWEKERAEEHAKRKRDEEMGISSRQKISKKDMERFKAKKAEKKARSTAWLRD